jgi:hypothetical protein
MMKCSIPTFFFFCLPHVLVWLLLFLVPMKFIHHSALAIDVLNNADAQFQLIPQHPVYVCVRGSLIKMHIVWHGDLLLEHSVATS